MKKITYTTIILFLLIAIAAFLRLFKLEEFTTFLADQGRDAIIMKRIVTLEHLTAIGPTSSIGFVFLGPFFYYLMAPFLLIFNFNPLGMAYGAALLSLAGIGACFYLVKKEIGGIIAVLFGFLVTFSFVNIEMSRFSWNPNLLPIFSFLTLYFYYQFLNQKKNLIYAVLTGLFLAFTVQLHHLAFFLGPAMFIYLILHKTSKKKLPSIKSWLITIGAFIAGYSPLILFDLRHQFINTKSFFKLFAGGEFVAKSSLLNRFTETVQKFISHVFEYQFSTIVAVMLFILIFAGYIVLKKRGKLHGLVEMHFIMFFTYIILFSLLNSERHPHYFAAIYFSFYLVVAYLLSLLPIKSFTSWILIGAFIVLYIANQTPKYRFFYEEGNFQIKRAEKIAQSILDRKPVQPYQIAGLPFYETEEHIRYFLEKIGPRPLEDDSPEDPTQLYVICHTKCQPLADPQWQIAAFKNGKIVESWKMDEITIYKAVHEK